jgi:hyperosmotically inducible periplasmic protein
MNTIKIRSLIGALMLATSAVVCLNGCAGDRYHESTGEGIDDTAITARVKSALHGDTEYKYSDVKVSTFKGTVQLSGFVETHAQKSRAADLAKNCDGVKDVENNISTK